MAKNKPDFDPENLDALLDFDAVVEEKSEASETAAESAPVEGESVVEAPAAVDTEKEELLDRIARLEAILEKQANAAASAPASTRPKPYEELSPEERRERDAQDQAARQAAKAFEHTPDRLVEAQSENTILIHFVDDGFTALGRTWYRGQELEFDIDGEAYKSTLDRNGRSWLEDTEADQGRRFKKLFWRRGPWPGDGYDDSEAAAAERSRNRAAPIPANF